MIGNCGLTGTIGNRALIGSIAKGMLTGSIGNHMLFGSIEKCTLFGSIGNHMLFGSIGKRALMGSIAKSIGKGTTLVVPPRALKGAALAAEGGPRVRFVI